MTPNSIRVVNALWTAVAFAVAAACTAVNPNDPIDTPNGGPSPIDAPSGGPSPIDAPSGGPSPIDTPSGGPSPSPTRCAPDQPLRCRAGTLVRCGGNGAEVTEQCPLGCHATELRCAGFVPSNGLVGFLDQTSSQLDIDLGNSATINTDTGVVTVDNAPVAVNSTTMVQSGAPSIRVLMVRSLTAHHVAITGKQALAVVAAGDIKITGVFAASATLATPGAGAFTEPGCSGKPHNIGDYVVAGAGGGGFGSPGGSGGSASSGSGRQAGAFGGRAAGNASLVPLRGGCDGGASSGEHGAGGGAIQLVSRTQIVVGGTVAANGSGRHGGGGSGGGILLEAPIVNISGALVANGGGGGGGDGLDTEEHNGQLGGEPASGGPGDTAPLPRYGRGGSGGAGTRQAQPGENIEIGTSLDPVAAGDGGGGVGRIRINTAPGGLRGTGLFSPPRSEGPLGTR